MGTPLPSLERAKCTAGGMVRARGLALMTHPTIFPPVQIMLLCHCVCCVIVFAWMCLCVSVCCMCLEKWCNSLKGG